MGCIAGTASRSHGTAEGVYIHCMQVASAGQIFVDRSETFVAVMSEMCYLFGCGLHFVESRH